jgi:hypothetical protein
MRIGRAGEPLDEHGQVQAKQLQDQHADRILANQLRTEPRWDRPCRAFNLQIRPPAQVTGALSAAQDVIGAAEPALLRVTRHALHSMAAWLIPVELEESAAAKERLWQQHRGHWDEAIAAGLASQRAFRLRYTEVVATDSAVIALAWPAEPVNRLRRALAGRPGMPPRLSSGDLVHCTLFRYRAPLADPAALLERIAGLDVATEFTVREFVLLRETVFPSIGADVLDRFPLREPAG